MAPGKPRDAPGADLAAVGDEAADRPQVLVVDRLDVDPRVLARAEPVRSAGTPATGAGCARARGRSWPSPGHQPFSLLLASVMPSYARRPSSGGGARVRMIAGTSRDDARDCRFRQP